MEENDRADGDAWNNFFHEHAREWTSRSGEDGIVGVCKRHGILDVVFTFGTKMTISETKESSVFQNCR